jgi:transposase
MLSASLTSWRNHGHRANGLSRSYVSLLFLPLYSAELNLIEILWKRAK